MPKLNLDPDHISDFLNEPNFESETPPASTLLPPLPCRIVVTLDDVVPYDKNPRQTLNPNYESIKESIRNRGLDDEPTITRRSADEPFMIRSGGNTRLAILSELYREYSQLAQQAESEGNNDEAQALRLKAEQFYRFEWNYKPWAGETNALIGHMVENEERGDMIYIEKAMAVKELQAFFNEGEKKPLSSRKLAQKITESGWSIAHTTVSLMLYTAELNEYLKKALWSGLGSPKITKLRAIQRAYGNFCNSQNISSEQLEAIWQETLLFNDDHELNIDAIRRYADQLISDLLGIEYFTVTAEIDVILNGGHENLVRNPPLTPEELAEQQQPFAQTSNNVVDINRMETLTLPTDPTTENQANSDTDTEPKPKSDSGKKNNASEPEPVTEKMLEEQRYNVYVNVMALAMQFKLMDFVIHNRFYGLGFYIDPIRDNDGNILQAELNVIDHPDYISRNSIWLYLKQLSLHQLMQTGEQWPIPNDLATSGSELSTDSFFSLNNHFHLMRFSDPNLQIHINNIEQSISQLLQTAQAFYPEDVTPVLRLFEEFKESKDFEEI